jgi:hypothetical protein
MAIITVEINDDLKERLDNIKSEVKDYFLESIIPDHVDAETDIDDLDVIDIIDGSNDDGSIDSFVDSAVPVYTYHIKGLWFLHENEFITAYENVMGSDGNPLDGDGMTAIFCYLEQELHAELEDLVLEWAQEYKDSLPVEWAEEEDMSNYTAEALTNEA